ncbi:MGMT family protein [Ktedonobacter robiniae]|uniref:Methylated-DNA-[protein]-cysteine S-methyltransferase DNA binding domain-containing protein n=1 Tax=Ktedonobacter robiniae TaxID=2778365 RepID=A0ABQ3V2U3_9CHLR|nr:MGMT family protein [Ktedonobacter robiniae]GHO59481.1 hypothetical protein KSB_79560 [Ktedonobacter robiniae]
MAQEVDTIVDIPENRVKFFGGRGKMLLLSPAALEALIQQIPEQQLITTDLLRKKLTEQFQVQGTCPVTMRESLQALARDTSKHVAYWRVINANGKLIVNFPGGVESQARILAEEGISIDTQGKTPKVKELTRHLARFA